MKETNMEAPTQAALLDVVDVLVHVLAIEERRDSIGATTPLLGDMPELDSMAVVELAVALEERFDIVIDDEDFTGEVFDTVGTLATYIDGKAQAG
jgi:acyl carrier protein